MFGPIHFIIAKEKLHAILLSEYGCTNPGAPNFLGAHKACPNLWYDCGARPCRAVVQGSTKNK